MDHFLELEKTYGAQVYHPLPIVLSRGKGVWLWDIHGKKYLDMLSAYSAVSHGYAHPKLLKVLKMQAGKLAVPSRAFYNDQMGPFLKQLCELSQMDMAIPMNTGAEAVETAIKSARLWGYLAKKIPENQAEIIVAEGNFHGRTTTIVSFSSEEDYKRHFGPPTPGFKIIPFADAQALERAITPYTCAFLVEPMQGEAGIRIPPKGWLKEVEAICKKHNVLLLLDEVQTGLGRTGKLFGFQHESVDPDGIILGKALGGGLLPVSAFVAKKKILSLFKPGMHGSTFGGNPLACAVAREALRLLEEEDLVARSEKLGNYLLKKLRKLESPLIKEIRGKGLWIGIEVHPERASARKICEELMRRGILAKETHHTVIRLAPPLVIKRKEIDWVFEQLREILEKS